MNNQTIVAIMYDFDRTLSTRDMQDYSFIPSLGMTDAEFWSFTNEFGTAQQMDSILAYMYAMVKKAEEKNMPLLRDKLVEMGRSVEFFNGVEGWFDRITSKASLPASSSMTKTARLSGQKPTLTTPTKRSSCTESTRACSISQTISTSTAQCPRTASAFRSAT